MRGVAAPAEVATIDTRISNIAVRMVSDRGISFNALLLLLWPNQAIQARTASSAVQAGRLSHGRHATGTMAKVVDDQSRDRDTTASPCSAALGAIHRAAMLNARR